MLRKIIMIERLENKEFSKRYHIRHQNMSKLEILKLLVNVLNDFIYNVDNDEEIKTEREFVVIEKYPKRLETLEDFKNDKNQPSKIED